MLERKIPVEDRGNWASRKTWEELFIINIEGCQIIKKWMVVVKKPARKMALGVKFLLHKHEFRRQALPDVKATHSKENAQNPSAEEQKPAGQPL